MVSLRPHCGSFLMQTTELLKKLNASGHDLISEPATLDNMAKGIGLALFALSALINQTLPSDGPSSSESTGTAFKAKANRW